MDYWNNTQVQTILRSKSQTVPIGGTSAGMAVLSEYVYTSLTQSTTSASALSNPYDSSITLGTRFVLNPALAGVLTDTHWFQRDRLGRTLTFMARLLTDAWPGGWTGSTVATAGLGAATTPSPLARLLEVAWRFFGGASGGSSLRALAANVPSVRVIACDEQSAVVINATTRQAVVLNQATGPAHACYFMSVTAAAQRVCKPKTPLTLAGFKVFRASALGGRFDLGLWAPVPGSGGASYNVSAINGVLSSTQAGGALY